MSESAEFDVPTQEDFHCDLRALCLGAIRLILETLLDEEIRTLVGAGRWQRMVGRKDVRNGSYTRRLVTSMGLVELDVPRAREGGSAGEILGRYKRRTSEIDDAVTAAYVHGVSTRKMGQVTEALMGERVGRSTVSRITKTLEERVEALRNEPIEGEVPYLFLDATFLDARWARTVENVSALVAYGVGKDGHRRLLGISIGAQESEASWSELLAQLVGRGLRSVRLVIADAHGGLAAAARKHLPEAKEQRCAVHLERNVLAKTPQRLRGRMAREVARIFDAPSAAEAKARLEQLKLGLGKQLPEAMACLVAGFPAATTFYAFPRAHWRRIRSTNGLERLHGEIKRRIRVVGAFPDRASALRLITAVALHVTAIWGDRRYLDMSEEITRKAA
jgi:putative transposase